MLRTGIMFQVGTMACLCSRRMIEAAGMVHSNCMIETSGMIKAADMVGPARMVYSVVCSMTSEDQRQNRVKYTERKATDKYVKQKITSP